MQYLPLIGFNQSNRKTQVLVNMKNPMLPLITAILLFCGISKAATAMSYWSCNNESGTGVQDLAGFNSGTIINNVSWVSGKTGQTGDHGLGFNANGYVNIGNGATLSQGLQTDAKTFSIVFWVKTTDLTTSRVNILKELNSSPDGTAIELSINFNGTGTSAGCFYLWLRDAAGTQFAGWMQDTGVFDGQWHHIAFTVTADSTKQMRGYIGGQERTITKKYNNSLSSFNQPQYPWLFGASNNRGTIESNNLKGSLDDIAVYDVMLSSADISDIYQNGVQAIPKYILTMQVEPNNLGINTISPSGGQTNYDEGTVVPIEANYYKSAYSYKFDHWVGAVANSNSSVTTVTMTQNKTITAVYVYDPKCGDPNSNVIFNLSDINKDCITNFTDLQMFAQSWLDCTDPLQTSCDGKWKNAESQTLVLNGISKVNIFLGVHATIVEQFAASELQKYIMDISGATVPILTTYEQPTTGSQCNILIGRAESNEKIASLCEQKRIQLSGSFPGMDGYIIKSINVDGRPSIVLGGSADRSSLFAVYDLLERGMGVYFGGYKFTGNSNQEVVPASSSIVLPIFDVVERPAFKYRFVSDNGYYDGDKEVLVADWGAKNRCNSFSLTPRLPTESWQDMHLDELAKRGYILWGPGHALPLLTPSVSLFSTHPEYFPLLGGVRTSTYDAALGGCKAFCWSNPDAMNIFVQNAINYIQANPMINIFSAYPADGSQTGYECKCPNCSKHTISEWNLIRANKLAEAFEKIRPDLKIQWISYNECSAVPNTSIEPYNHGKNMTLFWCNEIREAHDAMTDSTNMHKAQFLNWRTDLIAIKTAYKPNPTDRDLASYYRLQDWLDYLKATDYEGEITVLEYYNSSVATNSSIHWLGYASSGPWPNNIMQQDFQFYLEKGICGWVNCTNYYNQNPNPYWNRMGAILQWNPWADMGQFNADFYAKYYGSAGSIMRTYYEALWNELSLKTVDSGGASRVQALASYIDQANSIIQTTGDAKLIDRIDAAYSFNDACVTKKNSVYQSYDADGSPK
jgi:hypothetical protein